MKIASMIDHTILAAGATADQIGKLCREAVEYGFASVCVNSCRVPQARALLADSSVKVCTVVGFPLGAMSTKAKAYEAAAAVEDGADEVDMVINIGYVKDGAWDSVLDDIKAVRKACGDKVLKVILETCLLTDDEIVRACRTAVEAGADFVKTSTGFSTGGATEEAVRLMRKTVGPDVGVKASGGIRNLEAALRMVEAGASRLGCSSGVAIAKGEEGNAGY